MRVLFLTAGTQSPSSRFRVEQYLRFYRAAGVDCVVHAGHGDLYNRLLHTKLSLPYRVFGSLRRSVYSMLAPTADLVFVQRTAFPHSALAERMLARLGTPLIFDVDDAVHLGAGETRNKMREQALADVTRVARHVVAGNRYLADLIAHPGKTSMIPTAIDIERYRPAPRRHDGSVVVGWMGTVHNLQRLAVAIPDILRLLNDDKRIKLKIVANAFPPLLLEKPHSQVEMLTWSAAREIEDLQSFDIGIMPLDDVPSARGKCGFKLLQYMAVGIPVVATAIGANIDIVQGSGAGALVAPGADWAVPLRLLCENSQARQVAGAAGRARAEERYAASVVAQQYLDIFEQVARQR